MNCKNLNFTEKFSKARIKAEQAKSTRSFDFSPFAMKFQLKELQIRSHLLHIDCGIQRFLETRTAK